MLTGFAFEHFTRRAIVQCLVRPLVVVERQPSADAPACLGYRAVRLNEHVFVLQASPQPFDENIVCALPRCTVLPGGNPGRQTLAPAGSTRGGPGGDEWPEALREKSPLGGQRTVRAVTRVNIEQASKKSMWEPTRHSNGEGRRRR